jgi:queuine tRNA-ribosyltransferase
VNEPLFSFNLIAQQDRARAGIFNTPHGPLETPVFAPVGTQATVKALTPAQLIELGATLVLSNTYHLYLRPGDSLIRDMGGLHSFMNWYNPILTDSGGFQVFSLQEHRQVDEDGVTFRSHIDGSIHRFTPEISIAIQENLGADIIMAFDECAAPYDRIYIEKAMGRTHAWAERCLAAQQRADQALFGIVQGGIFEDLRLQSAQFITSLEFPGYAIGGLSVGETKEEMTAVLKTVDAILPEQKPRYLMGVGTPEDIVNGVLNGIDLFDCVLPTRLARHHAALTRAGRLNLVNAGYARQELPIEMGCTCYTCQNFSRAYIRHIILAKEMLSATLLSIHNLHMLIQLTHDLRAAIIEQKMEVFVNQFFQARKEFKTIRSLNAA